ncbi:unnamed protein product [Chilo suppressalis]|uniref:RRM domain-containing protein n=1 Tax=Chilo suppressalis TaxID=168631 RepID=A0ABN8B3L1_CHISP|nr:unnamed protein product [Chilo suppressalis]
MRRQNRLIYLASVSIALMDRCGRGMCAMNKSERETAHRRFAAHPRTAHLLGQVSWKCSSNPRLWGPRYSKRTKLYTLTISKRDDTVSTLLNTPDKPTQTKSWPKPVQKRDGRGYGPEGYGGEGFVPPPPMHHPMPPQNQYPDELLSVLQGGPPQQGAVMMVYGLDPQAANADRLFNLCCLYGNVVRIKFLKTKEGTAMVQMGDAVSVERCVQNLNNVTVGDYTLTLAFSKQAYLSEVMNPYPLHDKSPSFKDYVGNKNNRFLTPASIHKNRIQPPSKVVHFFNTPPDVSDEQLLQVFRDYGVSPPHTISKFPLKSESCLTVASIPTRTKKFGDSFLCRTIRKWNALHAHVFPPSYNLGAFKRVRRSEDGWCGRSSSGLMEFQNISQSVMAIMACNHATIQHPGAKFPFVMKLCFSSSRQIGQGKGPQTAKGQTQGQENQRQGQNNGIAEHEYY